jgi:hypothetical protein
VISKLFRRWVLAKGAAHHGVEYKRQIKKEKKEHTTFGDIKNCKRKG